MSFIIWHLLAICSVMAVAFGTGVWYGSNIYGRYQHTEEGSRAQTRATVNYKPKKKVRWTSKRGTGIEDTWNFPLH